MKMYYRSDAVIGAVVTLLRRKAELKQSDMVEDGVLEVKQSTYSRWEAGTTTIPLSKLRHIAKKLDVASAADLLQVSEQVERKLQDRGIREGEWLEGPFDEDPCIELEGKGLESMVKFLM